MISIRVTGLDDLEKNFGQGSQFFEDEVKKALGHSIAMAGTESQRRTPVQFGMLKSSIGGEAGYSYVRGLTAGIGTNVKYAIYVHENDRARHKVGEAHFMEKGLDASRDYIIDEFQKALGSLAVSLTKNT